jgi:hypothetical protein
VHLLCHDGQMIEIPVEPPAFVEAPSLEWPAGAEVCRVVAGLDGGALVRVEHEVGCEVFREFLDGLVGTPVSFPGRTLARVVLAPPDEGTSTTPRIERAVWRFDGWPQQFSELKGVPVGARCEADFTFTRGAGRDLVVSEQCPARLARAVKRAVSLSLVTPSIEIRGETHHGRLAFTWVPDPANPAAHVVLPEGPPLVRYRENPGYPPEARRQQLPEDRCLVRLSYDAAGEVDVQDVTDCHPIFAEEARTVVGQWRYWREVRDGVVQGSGELSVAVVFRLE